MKSQRAILKPLGKKYNFLKNTNQWCKTFRKLLYLYPFWSYVLSIETHTLIHTKWRSDGKEAFWTHGTVSFFF